jgi:heptosyltransferase-2
MTAPRPLIVRLRNWIGDVVLGLPALRELEQAGYALHLVARGRWAPALLAAEGWPVHVQPSGLTEKVAQLRQLRTACRALDPAFDRRENTLLLPVSLSSAIEARLAGLHAVGFAKEGRTPLLARAVPVLHTGHEWSRYHALACRFARVERPQPTQNQLHVLTEKVDEAARLLAAQGVQGGYLLICPFAGSRSANPGKPVKTWPAFPAFAARAAAELGLPVVVYPGPGEEQTSRDHYGTAVTLTGSDLQVYAALLRSAALVVANDTGPGHMAAALGAPVLSVLGPTTAWRWAPWGPRVTVLQQPPRGETVVWPTADEGLDAARACLDGTAATMADRAATATASLQPEL